MKYLIIIIAISLLFFSCSGTKYQKKQIGDNIVEAKFIDGNRIDGFAKFYNLSGSLEYEGNYINGVKNGSGRTFYENGKVKDSMCYINNLIHGKAYNYDSSGMLEFMRTNYYGLEIGDHIFYNKGKVSEYYFDNFERLQIVNCRYDSLERCDSLVFNAKAVVRNTLIKKITPAKNLFIYFPHPPDFEVIYKLSSTDDNQNNKKEVIINSDRLFLDTTFNVSAANYYLSVDYKNKSNDSFVNVLLQKL
jgi:hypothetical protein